MLQQSLDCLEWVKTVRYAYPHSWSPLAPSNFTTYCNPEIAHVIQTGHIRIARRFGMEVWCCFTSQKLSVQSTQLISGYAGDAKLWQWKGGMRSREQKQAYLPKVNSFTAIQTFPDHIDWTSPKLNTLERSPSYLLYSIPKTNPNNLVGGLSCIDWVYIPLFCLAWILKAELIKINQKIVNPLHLFIFEMQSDTEPENAKTVQC